MSWLLMTIFFSYFLLHEQSYGVEGRVGFGSGDQIWGHVRVRDGAHLFWWLYYANPPYKSWNINPYDRPLLIWIQGGPGSPGTGYGNFEEFGPLDIYLRRRSHTWVNDYNVLFIDTPVGTGFSYVDHDTKLAKNNTQMAADLFNCVKSFLYYNTKFQTVPTYILAESYGGKVAAEFALLWATYQNKDKTIKSNLRGVGLGDSFISPAVIASAYAPYLFHMGMINVDCYTKINNPAIAVTKSMAAGHWADAHHIFTRVLWAEIMKCTNGIDLYNILEKKVPSSEPNLVYYSGKRTPLRKSDFDDKLKQLMNGRVKKALSLSTPFNMNSIDIKYHLREDYMKPVTHIVEELLNETNLKVFVYNGQLDVIVPISSTVVWVQSLNWRGADRWKNATRKTITVDNTIEGYVQGDGHLKMFWVNRAGHMVPKDNPYAMDVILRMLTTE